MVNLNLFQFNIFSFLNTFIILVSVIVVVVFIIIIIIIYKIMHSNVNNVRKKTHYKLPVNQVNPYIIPNSKDEKDEIPENKDCYCPYCGGKISKKSKNCPLCGVNIE